MLFFVFDEMPKVRRSKGYSKGIKDSVMKNKSGTETSVFEMSNSVGQYR